MDQPEYVFFHSFEPGVATLGLDGVQLGIPNPRRTNRPLTALTTRLTRIHEEGRTGRCPRVLTDER